jgi:dihydrodipicolinate synthase/N-acetylneuraminate lyase
MKKKYSGVVIPMVTPFTGNGEIDSLAVEKICKSFTAQGCSTLLLGTTGESASLSPAQGKSLVRAAVSAINKKTTVYAGISGNCVSQNIDTAKACIELGVDVIVPILPHYYTLTSEQMHDYYIMMADALGCPVMVYNIPATTGMSIPLEIVEKLSLHPGICGFKDSERDEIRMEKCLSMFSGREDFSYFSGVARYATIALRKGADGIIPSTANLIPGLFRKLYDFSLAGNWGEAERLQNESDEIAKIYQEGRTLGQSLPALKTMMGVVGLCGPFSVPPLTTPPEHEQNEIRVATIEILKKYEILVQ